MIDCLEIRMASLWDLLIPKQINRETLNNVHLGCGVRQLLADVPISKKTLVRRWALDVRHVREAGAPRKICGCEAEQDVPYLRCCRWQAEQETLP